MRRRLVILVAVLLLVALVAAPSMAAKPSLPSVTGGGVTQNFNAFGSPVGPPLWHTQGGFTARATADGVAGEHPFFGTPLTTYEAKGNVQAKTVDALTGDKLGSIHARVVCIANYGPASGVHAFDFDLASNAAYGGNDVWEIRFEITKADPALPFVYGSFLVQDNGQVDFQDESFANTADPSCGTITFFDLEPHLKGNITVH